MKTCSKVSVFREMQMHIKTMSYQFTPVRMGKKGEREMTTGAQESSCAVGSSLHGPSILERNLALPCEIKYAYLFLSDSTPPSLLTES